jgi:hypothetical protein
MLSPYRFNYLLQVLEEYICVHQHVIDCIDTHSKSVNGLRDPCDKSVKVILNPCGNGVIDAVNGIEENPDILLDNRKAAAKELLSLR